MIKGGVTHIIKPVKFIRFSPLVGEQIQNYGTRITRPYSHNTPSTEDTPADERLGDKNKCKSCSMDYDDCPGHFGYINLATPIYNPNYISYVVSVLKCFCVGCAQLFVPDYGETLKNDGASRLIAYRDRSDKVRQCNACGEPKFKFSVKNLVVTYGDKEFTAEQALAVFERISNDDLVKLGINTKLMSEDVVSDISLPRNFAHPHQVRPEAFIFTSLPVIPIQARPHIIQNNERKEDTLTEHYNIIIKTNNQLALKLGKMELVDPNHQEKKRGGKSTKSVKDLIATLQRQVYMLIDNRKIKGGNGVKGNEHRLNSLSERLSGKHGHIQTNAGGKRSDQSARDVIVSAGPYLKMNQFGIPEHIAKTLTTQEVITAWNIDYFTEKLFNRRYTCPRCNITFANHKESQAHETKFNHPVESTIVGPGIITSIQRGRGIQDMKKLTNNFTKELEINGFKGFRVGDRIERQLQDGDRNVFVNRQPTISIESIQNFEIVILRHGEKAFHLPPPVTRAFNADYDGEAVCALVVRRQQGALKE